MKTLMAILVFFVVMFAVGCSQLPQKQATLASVVRVSVVGGTGSATIVQTGDTSLLITNYHVARNEGLTLHFEGKKYKVTLVRFDEKKDLALISVKVNLRNRAHFHQVSPLNVFDEVILIGAGRGNPPYPTKGIVSLQNVDGNILISGGVVGGMSGGAVYRLHDNHYEMVGVIVGMGMQGILTPFGTGSAPVNNLAYVIPVKTMMEFINGD